METLNIAEYAGLIALVWKAVDFMRLLGSFSAEKSALATQALAWAGGVLVVAAYAASDFAAGLEIGGLPLSELNLASLVLIGVSLGSVASAAVDVKQSIDSRDTAVKPPLL